MRIQCAETLVMTPLGSRSRSAAARHRQSVGLSLLQLLLLVLAAATAKLCVAAYDPISVPIRPPILPYVPRLRVPAGGDAPIVMRPADLSLSLTTSEHLNFSTPRYLVPGVNDCNLQAPAIVVEAVCNPFSISLTNQIPFQQFHTCPGIDDTRQNGARDFPWTNLHTHGLKVDPGATNISNLCAPGYADAGFVNSSITTQQYYCDANASSQQFCKVRGDNIVVIDRPLTKATLTYNVRQHPGATIRYTYPLEQVAPGVFWYHPHQHGSVGIQTPTSAAPLIIPESTLPAGLWDMYTPNGAQNYKECDRLIQVLESMPLEEATILQFYGIWFRNTTSNTPDDDTIPFLGNATNNPGDPKSALLFDASGKPLYDNAAGRDWALVNGAFQPTVSITATRYSRWTLLNTMTMKWLDLTIQKVNPDDGSLTPVDTCKFWMLSRDGVPLPTVPRLLRSKPLGSNRTYNDIIMAPATRVGALLKCDVPGTYVLVSGAGPFHTNYTACQATHCECFGDKPANGATLRSANNLYGGLELDAAVLAVVEVLPLPFGAWPQPDFQDSVCRSRLDRIPYLDYKSFPQPPAPTQCFSFMNQQYGGFCSINNQLFPDGVAYVEQGSQQIWNIRDITFHPFHLHETPVRMMSLPPCATQVTNNIMVGDWLDTILLPTCQSGCPWPANSSGNGTCGDQVTVCDQTTIQFLATNFRMEAREGDLRHCPSRPPSEGDDDGQIYRHGSSSDDTTVRPPPAPACKERVSVFHCHILPHEDEGCMALIVWTCPGFTPPPAAYPAQCPSTYTLGCSTTSQSPPPNRARLPPPPRT